MKTNILQEIDGVVNIPENHLMNPNIGINLYPSPVNFFSENLTFRPRNF